MYWLWDCILTEVVFTWTVAGALCEVMLDPCLRSMCKEGSTCVVTEDGGFECQCPENMEGEFCEYGRYKSAAQSCTQHCALVFHVKLNSIQYLTIKCSTLKFTDITNTWRKKSIGFKFNCQGHVTLYATVANTVNWNEKVKLIWSAKWNGTCSALVRWKYSLHEAIGLLYNVLLKCCWWKQLKEFHLRSQEILFRWTVISDFIVFPTIVTERLKKIAVPQFNGSSLIDLPLGEVGSHSVSIRIWFKSSNPNGKKTCLVVAIFAHKITHHIIFPSQGFLILSAPHNGHKL